MNNAYPTSAVVIQTGFLGDAVLASGMLRALRRAGVERLGIVVRSDVAEIYDCHPALASLHRFDKRERGASAAMADELKRAGYDAAIVAHRSARSAFIARRAAIARRVGFRQGDLALLHTDRVHYSIAAHELDRNAMLVEKLGRTVPRDARRSWLVPQPHAVDAMRARGGAGAIVIAPGSAWATKRWTEEGFVDVARSLVASGRHVLLVGGAEDRDLCGRIAAKAGVESLAGTIGLAELVALTAIAARVVSNDSAPLHVAEAVGTPVTAMFGPTVPEFGFGPVGGDSHALGVPLPCRPCRIHGGPKCPIGTHACMRSIAAADVLAAID